MGVSGLKSQSLLLQNFKKKIEQACEEIPDEMCRKVCHSVLQRFRDCLDNEGQFLSY